MEFINRLFNKPKLYILMHKDVKVLSGEYNEEKHRFEKIVQVFSYDHLPYSVRKGENGVSLKRLDHWFRWRGIPDYRVGLNVLLDHLDISDQRDLLDKEYALSVSDHYWIHEEKDQVSYEDLNFFERSYDQDSFGISMFASSRFKSPKSGLHTPNNTLCGYQKKAWFQRNGINVLLKGGTPIYQQEPINEWIASEIANRLGIDAVQYHVEVYENQLVSVCDNMLDLDTELITAEEVLSLGRPDKDVFWLTPYQKTLTDQGITDAAKKLDDLLVLDFIMTNTDRHNQNLGVIRDANTLQWLKVAPIFDTGTGLGCLKEDNDIANFDEFYHYRLFNSDNILDNICVRLILNLKQYDFSALDGIEALYEERLRKYQRLTGITDRRIDLLTSLLRRRIEMLKQAQQTCK